MSATVDEIITSLRDRLGAENDADLARKLRINKSTISSWRSRGNVPKRFIDVLDGESHQMFGAAPQGWADHEQEAFALALFRYGRLTSSITMSKDYRRLIDLYSTSSAMFWALILGSQKDIMMVLEASEHSSHSARLRLMYDDIEMGDKAIDRDKRRLGKMYSGWIDLLK